MCREECYGNQYRGCGHYVLLYMTGNRTDCGSPDCFHSVAHRHQTARMCKCNRTIFEDRRVLNLIQEPCDTCKEATYDRGRRR